MSSPEFPTFCSTGKHWLQLTPAEMLFAYSDREYDQGRSGTDGRTKNYLKLRLRLCFFHDNAYFGSMHLFRTSSPDQDRQTNTNAFSLPTEEVSLAFNPTDNTQSYDQPDQDTSIKKIVGKMLKPSFDTGDIKTIVPVDSKYEEPLVTRDAEIPELVNKSTMFEFRELSVMVLLSLPDPPLSFQRNKLVISHIPAYYQHDTFLRDIQELSDYRDGQVNDPPPRIVNYREEKVNNPLKDTDGAKSLTPAFMDDAAKAFERYESWLKDVDLRTRGFGD